MDSEAKKDWSELQVGSEVQAAIQGLGFQAMTPVQATCIPVFLKNKDVAVEAVTGSGKTLAFVIPVIEMLLRRHEQLKTHEVGAIIISPTQELALQTYEVVSHFTEHAQKLTCLLMTGGYSPIVDIQRFQQWGSHIIVATPGRLCDLCTQAYKNVHISGYLKSLEVLILDEADRLLDLGFETSLTTILEYLPKQRRTGLFSATQTREVEDLIRAGLRNPVFITVKDKFLSGSNDQRTPVTLQNFFMVCEANQKLNVLINFLQERKLQKHLVFFSTCACVDYFTQILSLFLTDINILSMHRKMKNKRRKIFENFKNLESGVLLCTDVLARGIDIPAVHWVVQYDPPSCASVFIHRCGRTARIGNVGSALVLLLPNEDAYVNFLKLNQQVILKEMPIEDMAFDVIPEIKAVAKCDRDLYEKGMIAFVSYVQAYSKHECKLLFQVKDLDFGALATGFALLRLPKMPELKHKVKNFAPELVDIDAIPYKNLLREQKRQVKLQAQPAECTKRIKKHPLGRRKGHVRNKNKSANRKRKRTKEEFSVKELEELAKDTRLMKKLKQGKIHQEEFDKLFGLAEDT